mmetsp:Transcript_30805/g.66638  ORF Transcript_30805/g.66638 Transcript_30805/m.66638 type:complete len:171 (-) Transcript_30805:417-929(-)
MSSHTSSLAASPTSSRTSSCKSSLTSRHHSPVRRFVKRIFRAGGEERIPDRRHLPIQNCKIVVCGDEGTGKTSLLQRFTERRTPTGEYSPTIGVDFGTRRVGSTNLLVWDLAGQERVQSINWSYLRGAHVVMLVVDGRRLSKLEFANTKIWVDTCREFYVDTAHVVLESR